MVEFFEEEVHAVDEINCAGALSGCNIVGSCGGNSGEAIVGEEGHCEWRVGLGFGGG